MKKDNWILKVFILTFVIALIFNSISNILTSNISNLIILIILDLLFVFIGIFFDIIGTSALTAEESTFHSMSAKKIKGAKKGVQLIKNSDKVSSIFCDILGDICGIITGGISAVIGIYISSKYNISSIVTILLISSIISSITVGGKAIGKKIAIKNNDKIIYRLAKFLDFFNRNN